MSFVLTDTLTFWWPVTVSAPNPKVSGRFVKSTFKVEFEAIGADEARQIRNDFLALESDDERAAAEHRLLERAVRDWADVIGPGNETIAFSAEALRRALQFPWVARGLYTAWSEAMSGEARKGN